VTNELTDAMDARLKFFANGSALAAQTELRTNNDE